MAFMVCFLYIAIMKIAVTGANGFIGRRILESLLNDGCFPDLKIAGISGHPDAYPRSGYSFRVIDMTQGDSLSGCLDSLNPDVIINTTGISVMGRCESDPGYACALNADAVQVMASWCAGHGARLVQISTDTVFSGREKVFHKEDDGYSPLNVYGRTKVQAEEIILRTCTDYAILRVVLVYGRPLEGQHGNIVRLVMDRLSAGETVNIVDDQWRTPTYVGDVAWMAVRAALSRVSGIWHVCGRECLSIYEMACKVASICGLDSSLIHPVHTDPSDTGFERPVYGLLDISKAERDFGFAPVSFERGVLLSV